MRHFRPDDMLSRAQGMLSADLDQETVLMAIDAGAYFGLDGTAQRIWQELETPVEFCALVETLVAEYQIAPEECAADLEKFLREMEQEGLIHVE